MTYTNGRRRPLKRYLKEFWSFPDILITSGLFLISLTLTAPHLSESATWIALVAGMVGYAASEYTIHRFLFHMKPPKNPSLLRLLKRLHYDHHVHPDELHLLFLPVWYSLPNIAGIALIVYAITARLTLTAAFVTGVIGYLLFYEWTHYIAHRPVQPLTPWGRWMKKVHLWHHYKNEHYWYGVTNPAFDLLLGTFKDEKTVPKSKTARNLEQRGKTELHL
ncbi:sterol desaturase family protein [Effusibacillus pohliae]|uniref:sterol desaturase family protein n=1 Tax=Effusibacillus pohliae TaxID=232270 RepID=UPI0003776808|nr:sterol desaturase family protein [Effusibacillus pohliae]